MTKKEAIELESSIDKLFSEKLETECEVSMALTGALRIFLDGGFFNIKADTETVDWVKWNGDYADLWSYIDKAILVIRENKEKIDMLIQSYRMQPFLKESEE